jgi:hypothetical protein
MAHVGIQACVLIATLLCAGSASTEESNDLRDLRVGMSIAEIPAGEYVDLTCAVAPENRLDRWAEYRKCPTDGAGIRGVAFHFNEGLNPLAQVNETYEGTKIAGHPVLLTLLIDNRGIVDGLRIDTDPKARLFWRKKAHLLAFVVKSRYGEADWDCRDIKPSDGETAVGGLFIKQHCEKTANNRRLALDEAVYRRPGQSMNEFVNETHVEIRRRADRS